MGSNIYFPPQRPVLKLSRASGTLRATIESAPPPAAEKPPAAERSSEVPIDEAWRKLLRARELFETEQSQMVEERAALYALAADLKRREEAIAAREQALVKHERLVAAAAEASQPKPDESDSDNGVMSRLTRAPMEIARAVLGGKK